jgi:allantoinase
MPSARLICKHFSLPSLGSFGGEGKVEIESMERRPYGPFEFSAIAKRPPLKWPNGAKLALWVVPNLEVFHLDTNMPGDANERPSDRDGTPMVRQWSQRDYGNRVGVWRIMEILAKHNVRATAALNSDLCLHMPVIIDEARKLGWEFMGHCKTNTHRLTEIAPDQERAMIKEVLDTIEGATGSRPAGWLGAGLQETWNTLEYLIENGCRYVADWVNDDQPYLMDVGGRQIASVPYSYELNDAAALWKGKKSIPEFERMIRDAFDVLYREGHESGRVMALCLHPFMIGQASSIGVLDRALDYILSHEGVWAATGTEILDAYLDARKA